MKVSKYVESKNMKGIIFRKIRSWRRYGKKRGKLC